MVRIALAGAAGRMGREIASAAFADLEIEIAAAFEAPGSSALGADVGSLCGQPAIDVRITDDSRRALGRADVLIEFTTPSATVEHTRVAAELGRGAVLGTTGLDDSQLEAIRLAASRIPIVMAPNMSVGVNVLLRVLPDIVRMLGTSYDVEIVEAHHGGKKDAPSGTALKLAEAIVAALDGNLQDVASFGRQGLAPRRHGEVGIHAVRAGGIVGDHQVIFANEGEQIEVVHRAFSRQTFALGALRAAKYVAGREPGLYSMHDVLES